MDMSEEESASNGKFEGLCWEGRAERRFLEILYSTDPYRSITCKGSLFTRGGIPVKCNAVLCFATNSTVRYRPQGRFPNVPIDYVTNVRINMTTSVVSCLYCDCIVADATKEEKIRIREFCVSYNYHSKIRRRCSRCKGFKNHRHHYDIHVNPMEKCFKKGETPVPTIDSAIPNVEFCRSVTPNMWAMKRIEKSEKHLRGVFHACKGNITQ